MREATQKHGSHYLPVRRRLLVLWIARTRREPRAESDKRMPDGVGAQIVTLRH